MTKLIFYSHKLCIMNKISHSSQWNPAGRWYYSSDGSYFKSRAGFRLFFRHQNEIWRVNFIMSWKSSILIRFRYNENFIEFNIALSVNQWRYHKINEEMTVKHVNYSFRSFLIGLNLLDFWLFFQTLYQSFDQCRLK